MAALTQMLCVWLASLLLLLVGGSPDGDSLRRSLIRKIYYREYPTAQSRNLAAVESQQVSYEAPHDRHAQAHSKDYGHYKKYHSGHHNKQSYKGQKGHENDEGYKSQKKAEHSKGNASKYTNKEDKNYKGHDKKHHYKGHDESGKKGAEGHHSGSKGHNNKGDKTEGYKNIWHSEEHGREKKFYDDFDHKTYHVKYDDYDTYIVAHDDTHYKGDTAKGGKEHQSEGKKNYHEEGKFHKDEKSDKKDYGHKEHYGDHEDYGKKGGYEESYKGGDSGAKGHHYKGHDQGSHSSQSAVKVPKPRESSDKYQESGSNVFHTLEKPQEPKISKSKLIRDLDREESAIFLKKEEAGPSRKIFDKTKKYVSRSPKYGGSGVPKNSIRREDKEQYASKDLQGHRPDTNNGRYAGYITHPTWIAKKKVTAKRQPEPKASKRNRDSFNFPKKHLGSISKHSENAKNAPSKKNPKYPSYFGIRKLKKKDNNGGSHEKGKNDQLGDDLRKTYERITQPKFFSERKLPTYSNIDRSNNRNSNKTSKHFGGFVNKPQTDTSKASASIQKPFIIQDPSRSPAKKEQLNARIPIPILKKEDTQQVAVISSVRLKPSATVHGKGHGKSSGQKKGYHKAQGEKGEKGGKESSGYAGKHYGDHAKKGISDYADKGHKHYKSDDHKKDYKGEYKKGKKGRKGHHFGSKGHHNKGHHDKGFKNDHHKFEYSVKKKFYHDNDDKNYYGKYDDFDSYFAKFMEDNIKEHDFHGKEYKDFFGFEDYHKDSHSHDDHYGHKGHYDNEKHHKHKSNHGEKGHHHKEHGSSYGHH